MNTERFLKEELQKIHQELREHLNNQSEESLAFSFNELDIYKLLNHVCCEKIFYFKSKYEDLEILGLGLSKTIKGHELPDFLKKRPNDYLIAALKFEDNPDNSDFVLPEWLFIKENGVVKLTINKSFEYKNFGMPNLFFNPNFDLNLYDPFIPPWHNYEELPEHDQWAQMIDSCNQLFINGTLEKIVMSRKKIFDYDDLIEPIVFFKLAMEKNNQANASYAIFHQLSFGHAFISLTPEKLFSLKNQTFNSISLAASAPRGADTIEDQKFEELLASSDKLTREHMIVTDELVKKLKPLTTNLVVSPLETMKLPYIQHRSMPIEATLGAETNVLDLIKLLHPTPAIGGMPSEIAREKIREIEPTLRSFYAAPIGFVSGNHSELAVGIRSALIEENRLSLFGGAGIVSGSIAEDEWNETKTKMNPFLKVVHNE